MNKCNHIETIELEYLDGSKDEYCIGCDTFSDEPEWELEVEMTRPSLRDKMRLAGYSSVEPYEKQKLEWTENKMDQYDKYNPDVENREREIYYR